MIDYRYHVAFKRLRSKFRLDTIERHWDRIVAILSRA